MTRGTSAAPAVNVNATEMMIADSGSLRTAAIIAAHAHRDAQRGGHAREMRGGDPARGAEEHGRERRSATEGAEAETPRQAFAQEEQREGAERPRTPVLDEPGQGALAGEQHLVDALVGDLVEPDRERGHDEAHRGDDHERQLRHELAR